MVQNRLETISNIVTIDDDDSQTMNMDSDKMYQVLAQDLYSHEQVLLGQDEETVQLVNMLKFAEETHQGKNQDTLDLLARLQDDTNNEVECNQKSKQVEDETNLALNDNNFPPLQNTSKNTIAITSGVKTRSWCDNEVRN